MRNYQPQDEPIPGYRLQKALGQGSFGQVWKALGPGDVEVALKIIRGLDGRYAIREWQSLQNVMNLRQPNLVAVFGVWLKDESGKVLKKEEILALIPPEPAPTKETAAAQNPVQVARPGWAAGKRSSTSVAQRSATLASPDSGTMRAVEPRATTQGSSSTPGDVGSAGSDSGPLLSESGGSGGSGSDALSRALYAAKIPPLELVTAMTLGEGTLMDRLKEYGSGGIPRPELLSYMRDAARGVQFLNQNDVHHCDIKPENLMIVGGSVQVCDYGSALKAIYSKESRTHQGVTREYAAPEQLTGRKVKMHKSTDQYALAMTYYALRTGKYPWPDDGNEPIEVIKHSERYDFSDLERLSPWTFELDVIRRALRKNPDDRFPTLGEFMDELDQAAAREQQAQREKNRGFWRKLSSAACLLLAIGLGVVGWYYRKELPTLSQIFQSRPLIEEIVTLLKDPVPNDQALEDALRKLKQASNGNRILPKDKDVITLILEEKLTSKLNNAKKSAESGDGRGIERWLEFASRVPPEFQFAALGAMIQDARETKPLNDDLRKALDGKLAKQEFSEALKWSTAYEEEEPAIRKQVRVKWKAHALAQCKELQPSGLDNLLLCHQETSSTPDEMQQEMAAALKGYLVGAEGLLSGVADDWKAAAEHFRLVQSFLSKNQESVGELDKSAQPSLSDQAALGELSAILRQNKQSPQAWKELAGKLRDPGESAPKSAARYKLLLAAYADKQSSGPVNSPLDLPLLQTKVLVGLEQLATAKVDLAEWERDIVQSLQDRLQQILEENQNDLESSPQEKLILAINKDAGLPVALRRVVEALRKPTPDLKKAERSIALAREFVEALPQPLKPEVAARLAVLDLWLKLSRNDHSQADTRNGLTAFIQFDFDPQFTSGFLDALFACAAKSEESALQIIKDLSEAPQAPENSHLRDLAHSQAQVALIKRRVGLNDPNWNSWRDEWGSLWKRRRDLEAGPQLPDSPFRRGLAWLPAAFLEASASDEPLPQLSEELKTAFAEIIAQLSLSTPVGNSGKEPQGTEEGVDAEYMKYVRDLALETWPGLNSAAGNDSTPFLMDASSANLLQVPHRRARAGQSLVVRANKFAIPSDGNLVPNLPETDARESRRLLEGALTWLDAESPAAEEARAKLAIVLANSNPDPSQWMRIRETTDPLVELRFAERWLKQGLWAPLLLTNARAHFENREDPASYRKAVLQFGNLTSLTHVLHLSQASPAMTDMQWCERVWVPARKCLDNAGKLQAPSADLSAAYSALLGGVATVLERDRTLQVSWTYFGGEKDPDAPVRSRFAYFQAAASCEQDPTRRARWLVGEARAMIELWQDPKDYRLDRLDRLLGQIKAADSKYHGRHEIDGFLSFYRSRQSTDGKERQTHLINAYQAFHSALDAVKAVEFLEEREAFKALYLEDLSQAALEQSFEESRAELQLGLIKKAAQHARDAAQVKDELRFRPSFAYIVWANALEDMALHGRCNSKFYGEAESKLMKSLEDSLAINFLDKANVQANLGRVRFHAALVAIPGSTSDEKRAFIDTLIRDLDGAQKEQLRAKRPVDALSTRFTIAQIRQGLFDLSGKDFSAVDCVAQWKTSIDEQDQIADEASKLGASDWPIYRHNAADGARKLADYFRKTDVAACQQYDSKTVEWSTQLLELKTPRIGLKSRAAMLDNLMTTHPDVRQYTATTRDFSKAFAAQKALMDRYFPQDEIPQNSDDQSAAIELLTRAGQIPCRHDEDFAVRRAWLESAGKLMNSLDSEALSTKKQRIDLTVAYGKLALGKGYANSGDTSKYSLFEGAKKLMEAISLANSLANSSAELTCQLPYEPEVERGVVAKPDPVLSTLTLRIDLYEAAENLWDFRRLTKAQRLELLTSARTALREIPDQLGGSSKIRKNERLMNLNRRMEYVGNEP